VFSLVLLAALPGQFVDDAIFSTEKQKAVLDATVSVVHPGSREFGKGFGSGVVVGRRKQLAYVLTANHVMPPGDEGKTVHVTFFSAASYPNPSAPTVRNARVVERIPEADLAVIEVVVPETIDVRPIVICPKDKLKGLRFLTSVELASTVPVLAVGLDARDSAPTIVVDRVRFVERNPDTRAWCYIADRMPGEGRSGGPLVDQRGYLIGICGGFLKEAKKGFYLYVEELRQALDRHAYGFLLSDGGLSGS
jgi:S1-C subfamily serine protease